MKYLNIANSILVLLLVAYVLFTLINKNQPVVYVDTASIYNSFEMKKDFETKLIAEQEYKNSILDSLQNQIELISQFEKDKKEKGNKISQLQKNYKTKYEQFETDNITKSQKYNEQIWGRINEYIKEYAIENNHEIILGANGTGSLMYANNKIDITENVIKYINSKYANTKK
jgi:outer membrane protein